MGFAFIRRIFWGDLLSFAEFMKGFAVIYRIYGGFAIIRRVYIDLDGFHMDLPGFILILYTFYLDLYDNKWEYV